MMDLLLKPTVLTPAGFHIFHWGFSTFTEAGSQFSKLTPTECGIKVKLMSFKLQVRLQMPYKDKCWLWAMRNQKLFLSAPFGMCNYYIK